MMDENKYDPFIKNSPIDESVINLVNGLDRTKTFVVSEAMANQYALEIKKENTREPKVKQVANHYVIGEHHTQKVPSEYEGEFKQNLEKSEIVILEGKSSESRLAGVEGNSFMGVAQAYAIKNNKRIFYLNDELSRYYRTKSRLWSEKGVIDPEVNVPVLECLSVCIHYLHAEHQPPEVIRKAISAFVDITTGIADKKILGISISKDESERTIEIQSKVEKLFNFALQNKEGKSDLISLLIEYNDVDGVLRDSGYNWCLQNILQKNAERRAVIVVGKNHFEAVELAVNGDSVPPEKIHKAQHRASELFGKLNSQLTRLE